MNKHSGYFTPNPVCRLLMLGLVLLVAGTTNLATRGAQQTTPLVSGTLTPVARDAVTSPTTLTLTVVFDQDFMRRMQVLVDRFNSTQQRIHVQQVCFPGFYEEDVLNRFHAGENYDLILVPEVLIPAFANAGVLRPLDHMIAQPKSATLLLPWTQDIMMTDSNLYAIPFTWTPYFILCNASVFENAAVALPGSTWKWDDFLAKSEAITNAGKAKGFALESDWWSGWYPFLWAAGGNLETHPNFTTSSLHALTETFTLLTRLQTSSLRRPGNLLAALEDRSAAMMVATMQDIERLSTGSSWAVRPVPGHNVAGNNAPAHTIGYSVTGIGIGASSRFPRESEDFIRYLMTADAAENVIPLGLGLPCLNEFHYAGNSLLKKIAADAPADLLINPPTARPPRFRDFHYATELLKMQTRSLLQRTRTPEDAARALLFQIDEEMDF